MSIKTIKRILMAVLCVVITVPTVSLAVEVQTTINSDDLIKKKQSESNKYLTAKEAHDLMKAHSKEALFIDVRTLAEIEFVGWTPMVDAVIPYMVNDFDEWDDKNNRYLKVISGDFPIVFEELVEARGLSKNSPIIFMCRSGSRSAKAASLATKLGYTQAYTVIDGFEGDKSKEGVDKGHRTLNGWKNSGLPWDYKVDITKVLFNQ